MNSHIKVILHGKCAKIIQSSIQYCSPPQTRSMIMWIQTRAQYELYQKKNSPISMLLSQNSVMCRFHRLSRLSPHTARPNYHCEHLTSDPSSYLSHVPNNKSGACELPYFICRRSFVKLSSKHSYSHRTRTSISKIFMLSKSMVRKYWLEIQMW